MTKRANRKSRKLWWTSGFLVAALALSGSGCGPATSSPEPGSDGSTAAQAPSQGSILDRFFGSEPQTGTVPAGTLIPVRFETTLSSHESRVGESFTARVTQEVSVGGQVLVPSGSIVHGHVTEASAPEKVGGRARLSLSFDRLELPSGYSAPVAAVFSQSGKSENLKDGAIIAGSTLGGVLLGEAVHKGEGGVIGGIVGGLAGAFGATKTKGKPVVLPSGALMTLELSEPVEVEIAST